MEALPYIGYLARQADKCIPYQSAALKVVPFLAPEYTEPAMAIHGSLRTVSMGLTVAPHIDQVASKMAQKVENV